MERVRRIISLPLSFVYRKEKEKKEKKKMSIDKESKREEKRRHILDDSKRTSLSSLYDEMRCEYVISQSS